MRAELWEAPGRHLPGLSFVTLKGRAKSSDPKQKPLRRGFCQCRRGQPRKGGDLAGQSSDNRVYENVGTLWIAAEQPRQVPFRLRAFGTDLKLPFTWVPWTSPLLKPDGSLHQENMEVLIKIAKAAAWGMERDYKVRLGNISIDTLSRAAGPYNANDGKFAQTLMTAMTAISVEMDVYVAASDHMGKDESRGTKGSSDKEQFADTVFWYFLNGGKRTMELTKQRDGEDNITIEFTLPTGALGKDKYGEPIATCKVAWGVGH